MENWSLYEHVRAAARARGHGLTELGDAALALRTPTAEGVAAFRTRVVSMQRFCRVSEQLILERQLRDARVYAGFQRLSRLRPVAERYARIAQTAAEVVVFGEPDTRPLGMRVVELAPNAPLTREWFLVVHSSAFQALIVAYDLDGFHGQALRARRFEGLMTHASDLVDEAVSALEQRFGLGVRARWTMPAQESSGPSGSSANVRGVAAK